MGIGDLAKQHPRGCHKLFEGQGAADQKPREMQFTEHHPVQQPRKDDRQATQTALEQTQPQSACQTQLPRRVNKLGNHRRSCH